MQLSTIVAGLFLSLKSKTNMISRTQDNRTNCMYYLLESIREYYLLESIRESKKHLNLAKKHIYYIWTRKEMANAFNTSEAVFYLLDKAKIFPSFRYKGKSCYTSMQVLKAFESRDLLLKLKGKENKKYRGLVFIEQHLIKKILIDLYGDSWGDIYLIFYAECRFWDTIKDYNIREYRQNRKKLNSIKKLILQEFLKQLNQHGT